MRKALVLVAILLLTSSLAWAEGAAGAIAAPEARGQADTGASGGGCTLPDFTGLSRDQRVAAALGAGLQVSRAVNALTPLCPTSFFYCTTITNCKVGSSCTYENLGQCCDLGDGDLLCCAQGSLKFRHCLCTCSAYPCPLECLDSTDARLVCVGFEAPAGSR
jgi:hypothetical protein